MTEEYQMRELAILSFVTLDGVMQAPSVPEEDQSGGFKRGGWAMPWWEEVMEQVQQEAMAEPYDLLLGRTTYEIFSPHLQDDDGSPESNQLNDATKFVVTNTPGELQWKNSVRVTGEAVNEVSKLKRQNGPLLQVHGSWKLIQTLLMHDLVDEFRIWTFPVLVGSGKRLFSEGTVPAKLTLVKTGSTKNGAIMSVYRRANIS